MSPSLPRFCALGLFSLTLSSCVSKGPIEAVVVDGLTQAPRGDLQVVLTSPTTTDLTCKVLDGRTDAQGRVRIEDTCADTEYVLSVGDDSLVLVGSTRVTGGAHEGAATVELQAWRAPNTPGVYLLGDDKADRVRSRTRLMRDEKIIGTETVAVYPESVFSKPSVLEDGHHLMLVGTATIENTRFMPVIPDPGKRTFASGASLTGHAFVGLRFTSDEAFEEVDAELDLAKVVDVREGDRAVRYIPVDALPPGQYAIHKEGDREALIVGFGTPAAPATAKADAAPAAEPGE